jgi:uncharacterized protein YbbC (DUF1343 family)
MKLSFQVILSTLQAGIAGQGAKDLFSNAKARFFAKAQNDNTLCVLIVHHFIQLCTMGLLLIFILIFSFCEQIYPPTTVGLDEVISQSTLFKDKRVGIITNHTAYNSKGQFIAEVFLEMESVQVVALFSPEHGIRGEIERGKKIDSHGDSVANIPVISLYGNSRKPTPEMLKNINLLVFDIQDVGARFYTYIYNMALTIEAAAEQGIPYVVLDRPNPINGVAVEGNILDSTYSSFMGLYPIPVRHGMTVGELAQMFNGEGWFKNGVKADLTVISLKNWKRQQWYDDTGLKFIAPSPNMPDLKTATVYPGLCLLEGTNVSEGRGTTMPFQLFGAPWIEAENLTRQLNFLNLPGIRFKDTSFTPVSLTGKAENPKFRDETCFGARIIVADRTLFKPYYTGLRIVNTLYKMYPDSFQWRTRSIQLLSGTDAVRQVISKRGDLDSLTISWQKSFEDFLEIRKKYLLYE